MKAMKRFSVLALVLVGAGAIGRTAPAETGALSLSELFKPGVVFQDRNGDGAIDFVDARLVLSEQPSAGELAAASNIAARLGYETSAMNLPMVRLKPDATRASAVGSTTASAVGSTTASAVGSTTAAAVGSDFSRTVGLTIFIGAKSLARADVTAESIGGAGLKAGDGLVTAFTLAGKPAVAVIGGDDTGLSAAAVMLAGHLPYVWDQKSPTIDKIADEVKQFLAGKGVIASSALASALFVRAGAAALDGADRLVLTVEMANGGDVIKGQVALNQFKATSARDAKRPLSYANVRTLQVRMRAPGMGLVTVDLPRAAAPQAAAQPPARRPGGGAKESFDLSTFYTNEGALADSDNNLIPDRVDVLLSAEGDGADGVIDLAARLGLESTGVSLPIAKTANAIAAPDSEPILVLVGTSHPVVEQLIKNKKWEAPSLQPGED